MNKYQSQFNLFIGGVSSSINTKALLAAKFTFTESDVVEFEIVGSDIKAYIKGSGYGIKSFAGSNITYINDVDSILTSFNVTAVFSGEASLNSVILNGLTSGSNTTFLNCSSLSGGNIQMNNITYIGASCLRNLKDAPNETLSLPSLINASARYSLDNCRCNLDLPLTETCDLETFRNLKYTLTSPSLTQIGSTVGNDLVFSLCASSAVINVPTYFATNNGGSPDGDLTYALGRGATVNYL